MKKVTRFLSFSLALLLLISPFSFFSLKTDAEEATDDTPKEETVVEDTVFFRHDFTKFTFSPNSGSVSDRWNKITGLTATSAKDPTNESNTVLKGTLTGTSGKLCKNHFSTEGTIVIAASLYMGEGITSYEVNMTSGTAQMKLTADGDGYSIAAFGNPLTTVAKNTWFRFTLISKQTETGNALTLRIDFQDGTSKSAEGTAKIDLSPNLWFNASGSADAWYLMDDTDFCAPVAVQFEDLAITYYADTAKNVSLTGPFTVTASHSLNPASFKAENAVLTDGAGNIVPSVTVFDPIHPSKLILTPVSPLATDTVFAYALSGLTDFIGADVEEQVFPFETAGVEGSNPRRLPIVEAPEGGYIMPDEYNTGYLSAFEDLVDFKTKYPGLSSNGSTVIIDNAAVKKYGTVFEGWKATGITITVKATVPVTIRDFYLDAGKCFYGFTNSGCPMITIQDGEGTGSTAAFISISNALIERVFVHDVCADHFKCGSNTTFLSVYARDGGTRSPGAHADVLQISCNTSHFVNNVRVLGCRFDIPHLCYEHVANACIFVKPESGTIGLSNFQVSGNWFNGGGYTTYLILGYTTVQNMINLVYTDNHIGWGYKFSDITKDTFAQGELTYSGNAKMSSLAVGSVLLRDSSGKTIDKINPKDGKVSLMMNVANYTLSKRQYTLKMTLKDSRGNIISETSEGGTVRAYISPKEYEADSNIQTISVPTSDGGTTNVTALINLPDLPRNVELTLNDFDISAACEGDTLTISLIDSLGKTIYEKNILAEGTPEPEKVVSPEILPGAAVKVSDPTAIRFTGVVSETEITRAKQIYGENSVTVALSVNDGNETKVYSPDKTFVKDGQCYYGFTLEGITDKTKVYTATFTVTIKEEGKEPVVLSAPSVSEYNARSAKGIAQAALADISAERKDGYPFACEGGFSPYSEAERAILISLAGE